MRVHANILDTILDTPNHASKTASSDLGDLFMDADVRATGRGKGAWEARKSAALVGEGELAEAFSVVAGQATAEAEEKRAKQFKSVQAAVKFASLLRPKDGVKLSAVEEKQLGDARAAGQRLARLIAKTPEQMKQDGASKLADYFDPLIVPAWAKQARADLALLQSIRDGFKSRTAKQASVPSTETILKENEVSDGEIKGYVKNLLNEGVEPRVVEEKLNKLAEVHGFTKSLATNYLNDHAGLLGLAYIEPNAYMNDCPSTYKRMEVKLGGVKAKSVKQIQACAGCQYRKCASTGESSCSLYSLPIVASQKELLPIINNLVPGAKNKKAALVAIANHEDRPIAPQKAKSASFGRSGAKAAHVGTAKQRKQAEKKANGTTFTASDVQNMHNAGESLQRIFAHGSKVANASQAKRAVQQFLDGLKNTKTRIPLTQIDCGLLARKLGSNNTIIGESKCAGCTYRKGMHCGLTGGTLVSFPGMGNDNKKKANIRTASGPAIDGFGMVKEFEMTSARRMDDIKLGGDSGLHVDLTGSQMDI